MQRTKDMRHKGSDDFFMTLFSFNFPAKVGGTQTAPKDLWGGIIS
jgi:hypothetical protein